MMQPMNPISQVSHNSEKTYPPKGLRLNPLDLQEELIEYIEEFSGRSRIIANMLTHLDWEFENMTLAPPKTILPPPAATSALLQLSHTRIHRHDKIKYTDDDTTCGVCLERLVDGIALTQLPCKHVFHMECALKWLETTCTCPECRYELETNNPTYEVGRRYRMKSRKSSCCNGCDTNATKNSIVIDKFKKKSLSDDYIRRVNGA